jgi:tungstate transport system substrate-binding protein
LERKEIKRCPSNPFLFPRKGFYHFTKEEKMNRRKFLSIILAMMLLITVFAGCTQSEAPDEQGEEQEGPAEILGSIILATTTSTQDSGLLDVLLPVFTETTGWEVDVVAVGSGAAMAMGENGEADVLLVHSPAAERAFIEAGHGPERYDVMYNDFVIIGPKDDPAALSTEAPDDAVAAFTILSEKEVTFVSRGDDSGTHNKELSIWKKAEIEPAGEWYVEAGQGMGAVITMADDMLGYTLSDRATWLNYAAETDLAIVTEGDPSLFNQYGVIVVDPSKNDQINAEGALAFQNWIIGEEAQSLIETYGVEEFGDALFTPNATGEPTND